MGIERCKSVQGLASSVLHLRPRGGGGRGLVLNHYSYHGFLIGGKSKIFTKHMGFISNTTESFVDHLIESKTRINEIRGLGWVILHSGGHEILKPH